ncbi:hypothetical protein TSA1_19800 [Bradyrhizobium nitroreducens]|uniref:Restriction endonuclease type IV Mrr domain-containing protein n=1 Tax=Bradyrhizobium nitroreducens TaxID=709803 RepID=A0A2M6UDR9_9BRAD|nr:hypothetical protein [Bradyrhizobium nitroreducens]PIT02746.1 hypothetical protein TSA1_19800 [Bradyrhizobium nitroreducens]
MAVVVSSDRVERVLRRELKGLGYKLSRQLGNGETGCDVIATTGGQKIKIEVVSFKSSGLAWSIDFFQGFFRVVSRLNDGATQCVIALPSHFGKGLPRRAAGYRMAWRRVGSAFPELEIWLVDVIEETIKRTSWNSWID